MGSHDAHGIVVLIGDREVERRPVLTGAVLQRQGRRTRAASGRNTTHHLHEEGVTLAVTVLLNQKKERADGGGAEDVHRISAGVHCETLFLSTRVR